MAQDTDNDNAERLSPQQAAVLLNVNWRTVSAARLGLTMTCDDLGQIDSLRRRFWRRVRKGAEDSDECWLWTGAGDGHGYGSLTAMIRGVHMPTKAHRLAYLLAGDEIPEGMSVCHRCDNRLCVRRSHLWLGTNAENNYDAVAKGRNRQGPLPMLRGERNPHVRLTAEQVMQARRLARAGTSVCQIAREMGVNRKTLNDAISGKTWPDLPCDAQSAPFNPGIARGARHYAALLSVAQVQEIRLRFVRGESARAIASATGLNRATIRSIVEGRTWREIPPA